MQYRRLLPGILSIVLALSLAACGGVPRDTGPVASDPVSQESPSSAPPSAFETLKSAGGAMDLSKGLDMQLDMVMKQAMTGMTVETGINGHLLLENETKYNFEMTQVALGQEIPMSIYRDGAYTYTDMMGMKIKSLAEEDESFSLDLELKEEYFKSLEVSDADGVRTVTGSINPEKMKELVEKLLESDLADAFGDMDEGLGDEAGTDLEFKAIDMTVKLGQDNLIHEMTVVVSVAASMEGPSATDPESTVLTEMQMDLSMTVTVNNPGEPVTVTPPADLEEYEEFSMDEGDFV